MMKYTSLNGICIFVLVLFPCSQPVNAFSSITLPALSNSRSSSSKRRCLNIQRHIQGCLLHHHKNVKGRISSCNIINQSKHTSHRLQMTSSSHSPNEMASGSKSASKIFSIAGIFYQFFLQKLLNSKIKSLRRG